VICLCQASGWKDKAGVKLVKKNSVSDVAGFTHPTGVGVNSSGNHVTAHVIINGFHFRNILKLGA
jgi:hypothetical protein